MKRISATDAVFLDIETAASPLIIGGLYLCDPSTASGDVVRHRDILTYVEERLHIAPNFRKKLVYHPLGLDEPRLIDDPDFDLEFHVRHLALPRPRDLRQLKILAARLMSRPMDLHRPLWELYLIEGLDNLEGYPEDSFAVMLKLHHATFDGAAAGAAIWSMMQDTPDFNPDKPAKRWVPERAPDWLGWTVSSIQEGFKQTFQNVKSLPALSQGTVKGGIKAVGAKESRATPPRTRFQDKVGSHRVFDWMTIPIAEVQAVRAALGKPKMNDLLLAVVAGGLRRYLGAKNELPEKPLLAMCPINVRGAGDVKEGGNFVSAMRVSLATDVADVRERLAAIGRSSVAGKGQAEAIGGPTFGQMLALVPYSLRAPAMRRGVGLAAQVNAPPFANTVVTNSPPPKGGHYFAGARIVESAGFGPVTEGMGLFHTISGLDFEVSISATSTREIMPDIALYMDCLREAFAELKAAAEQAASAAAAESDKPKSAPKAARRRKAATG